MCATDAGSSTIEPGSARSPRTRNARITRTEIAPDWPAGAPPTSGEACVVSGIDQVIELA
jgi:hypothetical protein